MNDAERELRKIAMRTRREKEVRVIKICLYSVAITVSVTIVVKCLVYLWSVVTWLFTAHPTL